MRLKSRADNVQLTCGWHESEFSGEISLADDIRHDGCCLIYLTLVKSNQINGRAPVNTCLSCLISCSTTPGDMCTSSAHVCMSSSHHPHTCMSSAHHLQWSLWSPWSPWCTNDMGYMRNHRKNSPIKGWGGLSKNVQKMSKTSIIVLSQLGQDWFNWKYFWGWNLMRTMCRWHMDNMRVRFGARFHLRMMYVVHTLSTHCPHVICTTCRWHPHVICTLSAIICRYPHHLQTSSALAWVGQFHAILHLVSCTYHLQAHTSSTYHPHVIHISGTTSGTTVTSITSIFETGNTIAVHKNCWKWCVHLQMTCRWCVDDVQMTCRWNADDMHFCRQHAHDTRYSTAWNWATQASVQIMSVDNVCICGQCAANIPMTYACADDMQMMYVCAVNVRMMCRQCMHVPMMCRWCMSFLQWWIDSKSALCWRQVPSAFNIPSCACRKITQMNLQCFNCGKGDCISFEHPCHFPDIIV